MGFIVHAFIVAVFAFLSCLFHVKVAIVAIARPIAWKQIMRDIELSILTNYLSLGIMQCCSVYSECSYR